MNKKIYINIKNCVLKLSFLIGFSIIEFYI